MKANNRKLIILTGGGTGGHIFPLMAVTEELKRKDPTAKLVYFGSGLSVERKLAQQHNLEYQPIICGKFRRFLSFTSFFLNIADFFRLLTGIIQSLVLFLKHRPNLIFSKGGYVCLPNVLAGAILRIPIISHESDVMPGLATRIALRYSRRIAVSFPEEAYPKEIQDKAVYTGLPLRKEFQQIFNEPPKNDHYLLVMGGSSGARSLNSMIYEIAQIILPKMPIIHLTGEFDYQRAQKFREDLPEKLQKNYQIYQFSEEIDKLIGAADLVVSRAGATAIFEIAACRKQAIFVPIDKEVTKHQYVNALYLQRNNLAEVILSQNQYENLLQKILDLSQSHQEPALQNIYCYSSSSVISQIILDEIKKEQLSEVKNIFLIGIMGISMKGLAKALRSMGKNVTGSDLKIKGHQASNITADLDLVVYSSAASEKSEAGVEHEQAKSLKIPILKRSEMIGWLMRGKVGISVSGMHGKTTISTLISRMFEQSKRNPSYLIGAEATETSEVAKISSGKYFIVEACEYDSSFLDFPTSIAVISNIEEEHLDYFKKGLPQIKENFLEFIKRIYPGGYLVYSADDLNIFEVLKSAAEVLEKNKINLISYGFKPSADYSIKHYKFLNQKASFTIEHEKKDYNFESHLGGKHFALNSAAALAVSQIAALDINDIKQIISSYRGAARRFYLMGKKNEISIYDDYAHHPTELEATLNSLSEMFPNNRKIIIFQPHQQSRFNHFYQQFEKVLISSKIEKIGILPVYQVPGRDEPVKYSSSDLAERVNKAKDNCHYLADYKQALAFLRNTAGRDDIVMTIGATDVYKVGEDFLENYSKLCDK